MAIASLPPTVPSRRRPARVRPFLPWCGRAIIVPCLLLGLSACRTVGPNYQKPDAPIAAHWNTPAPWRASDPRDALPKGAWWTAFHEDALDALETQAIQSNQTVKDAEARFEQARALTAVAFSALYPQASVDPSLVRERESGNRLAGNDTPLTANLATIPFTASYEVDLFGKRRRSIEEAQASLQASAATLENVRLVVAAELASDYFALQQLDTEIDILNRTVDSLSRGLDLVRTRYNGGVVSGLDVAQEESLLDSTRTDATLVRQQRDQFEHAIAALTGQPAPDFHLAVRQIAAAPPALDLGLPSDLLERRPDIAEAERQMAVANAQVGVAMSAYFPSLTLFGGGGWQSTALGAIFNAASTLWSIGASASEAIFTGGANAARVRFAQAGYAAAVAEDRDAVLNAMREVQDGVSGLVTLEQAATSERDAIAASQRALDIATSRYQGGLDIYLDVVSAQQTLLANQRLAAEIRGEALMTSVALVKALGGGWDADSLKAITGRK